MVTFWQTVPTVQALFGEDYKSFALFSSTHLLELAICVIFCVVMIFIFRKCGPVGRRNIFIGITAIMLADELAKYIVTIATGQWSWIYLPLHLCSINLFVCLANTIRTGDAKKEILYSMCMPAAIIALISPSWSVLPMWNFMHLHSFTIHCLLLAYPLLLLADGFRPDFRNLRYSLMFLGITAIPIYLLNKVLDTNFFFINGSKVTANAITNALAGIFGTRFYLVGFGILLVLVWFLLYLPWVVTARRAAVQ